MITSSRALQAGSEEMLALGITSWMSGAAGPDAVAASRIVAETIIMWRAVLKSKFEP
jgi:hypothetical protein